jgi:hypothetical protein
MNHQWSDEQQVRQESPGVVPNMVELWNGGVMPAKESSSSSGPAQSAESVNFQIQGQYPSGFSGKNAGAEGTSAVVVPGRRETSASCWGKNPKGMKSW